MRTLIEGLGLFSGVVVAYYAIKACLLAAQYGRRRGRCVRCGVMGHKRQAKRCWNCGTGLLWHVAKKAS
jgi:hypothetical protein